MLDGVLNVRELGGLTGEGGRPVRDGVLWRAGHLGAATDDDVARLGALGLGLVVDFRTDDDIVLDGEDRLPAGVRYVRTPIGDDTGRGAELRRLMGSDDHAALRERFGDGRSLAMATEGARQVVLDRQAVAAYRRFADELVAHAPGVVLFHCTAGKDRAGWAASVLLLALGVDADDALDHYLESNRHRRVEETLAGLAARGVDPELLRPFIEVRAEYHLASMAAVHEGWGSVEGYLGDGLGLDADRLELLRTAYLA